MEVVELNNRLEYVLKEINVKIQNAQNENIIRRSNHTESFQFDYMISNLLNIKLKLEDTMNSLREYSNTLKWIESSENKKETV